MELKDASRKRDDDTRRINDEVRSLQSMIPKAMKTQEENADVRLKELNEEMKSLKRLIGNRLGAGSAPAANTPASRPSSFNMATGNNAAAAQESGTVAEASPQSQASNPLDRFSSGKGGIPAWQMAAAKKSEETKTEGRP